MAFIAVTSLAVRPGRIGVGPGGFGSNRSRSGSVPRLVGRLSAWAPPLGGGVKFRQPVPKFFQSVQPVQAGQAVPPNNPLVSYKNHDLDQ